MAKPKNLKHNKTIDSDLQEGRELNQRERVLNQGKRELTPGERVLTQEEMEACQRSSALAEKEASLKALKFLTEHVRSGSSQSINPTEFITKAHLGANLIKRLKGGSVFTDASYRRISLGIVMFFDRLVELRTQMHHSYPAPENTELEAEELRAEFYAAFGPYATWALSLKQQGADLETHAIYLKQKAWHNKKQPKKKQPKDKQSKEKQPKEKEQKNSEIL